MTREIMDTQPADLVKILNGWRRWFRFRRLASGAVRGLIAGLTGSLLFSLIAVLRSLLLSDEFVIMIFAASLAGALLGGIIAFSWPFPLFRAARYFDRVFGLRERTSTALELAAQPRLPLPVPEMVLRQQEDALASARRVKPRERMPIRVRWGEMALILLLVAGVVLVWTWGGPYFQAAFQQRAVQNAISQETAKIEALQSQIEANLDLSPEQAGALTRPLEEALEKLRRARSMEQAVSALHGAEAQLRALASSEEAVSAIEEARRLQEAGNGLSQQQGSPLQSFGESLASGQILEAAQKLPGLDLGSLSAEQAEALAGQLDELASSLASADPALAQQIGEAAEALRQGDPDAAQQALQQAGQALSQAGQQAAQAQVAAGAAARAAQGQGQILQAGRSAGSQPGVGEAQNGSRGQGNEQGESGQSGSSEGSSPEGGTQNGAGGGAGRGEGSGEGSQGSEAGRDPIGQGNAPGDAGERPFEQIYAPQHLGGNGGEEVAVPASGQEGDQILGQGNAVPGTPGESRVPYTDVLPFYEEAYHQAIESGEVPLFLRDLVRKYFSSLQP